MLLLKIIFCLIFIIKVSFRIKIFANSYLINYSIMREFVKNSKTIKLAPEGSKVIIVL
jgi:hypothetical protein